MFDRKIRTGIIFSLILAFIVMTAIALYGDLPRMVVTLAHFRWEYLPIILGLTLFNYLGRFVKWQYYLQRLNIKLPGKSSLLIFLSGLSMAITPGKIGELLKSYLLKRSTGVAISRTSPIIVAERLTDGMAMLGLSTVGLVLYRFGWGWLLALLIVALTAITIIQNRTLSLALLRAGEQLPLVSRIAHWLRTFYESSYSLLQWRPLLLAISLGLISWMGECGALYFVYTGLGVPASVDLFMKATFILAISSLIGSASGLPGGLGTADGSMLGLTHLLVSTSASLGSAATLLIRFCTLWFGLLVGAGALLLYRTTQRVGISGKQESSWEERDQKHTNILPSDGHIVDSRTPSTSVSMGEKIV
ncbi:MAG TPA: lysylphosphatidylglycerol synthase transmembrane domain-containing protein [Ktedonobacteraceae bacterium]|nr:lysylphosphatidylglycerol synthase transmembrane domain-containing protein [Ktedonobacteraceae bacterium]